MHTRIFRSRGAVAAAFVLGVGVASVATAGAAGLLTGRQIKDGSIGLRDLSPAVRAKLGVPGPQGAQGPTGPQGPAGGFQTSLPSGQTLRGTYAVSGMGVAGVAQNAEFNAVTFQSPLATAPVPHFIGKGSSPTTACPGSVTAPEAAAGQLCVYEGGQFSNGTITIVDPATQGSSGGSRWGFILMGTPMSTATSFSWDSHGTWAVTAP